MRVERIKNDEIKDDKKENWLIKYQQNMKNEKIKVNKVDRSDKIK